MRVSEKQMTIGEILSALKRLEQDKPITFDFVYMRPANVVGSYRGYYEDLAIGYAPGVDCTVLDVVACLEGAMGKAFDGYKGGEYEMHRDTVVWVGNYGEAGGTAIVDVVDESWRVVIKTEMID